MSNVTKVLIVDDDKATTQVLSEVVKRLGLRPVVANRPADALSLSKLQYIQGAIVDVLLPKMSGVDLVEEMRKTKFADGPVILISGVFKDKSFAEEAKGKCGAIAYLTKPFDLEEIKAAISNGFENIIGVERWTVHSLLLRHITSLRERAKAVERLDGITGYDLPYILTFLMEVGLSGDLTIASESGEIFGAKLKDGKIAELDSEQSRQRSIEALIANGLLHGDDWKSFKQKTEMKFVLTDLVEAGLVSPHAMAVAQRAQILADMKSICQSGAINLSFALGEVAVESNADPVDMYEFMSYLSEIFDESKALDYLRSFYKDVLDSPLRVVGFVDVLNQVFNSPEYFEMNDFRKAVEDRKSISTCLKTDETKADLVYRCIHRLVLMRVLIFEDEKRAGREQAALDRYKKVFETLKDRRPDQVFAYFGASDSASPAFIEKIYQDYVRSSNPKALPADSSAELVEFCTKCFELVTKARDIMVDERRRAELFEEIKTEQDTKLRRSSVYVTTALDLIKKGNFRGALEQLGKAEQVMPSSRQYLLTVWASLKAKSFDGQSGLHEFSRGLESLPAEDRRTPYYYMAMGLLKRQMGDATAPSFFERALQLDPTFIEARREIQGGAAESRKNQKLDIFTDDITAVVSNLFKRKPK